METRVHAIKCCTGLRVISTCACIDHRQKFCVHYYELKFNVSFESQPEKVVVVILSGCCIFFALVVGFAFGFAFFIVAFVLVFLVLIVTVNIVVSLVIVVIIVGSRDLTLKVSPNGVSDS